MVVALLVRETGWMETIVSEAKDEVKADGGKQRRKDASGQIFD